MQSLKYHQETAAVRGECGDTGGPPERFSKGRAIPRKHFFATGSVSANLCATLGSHSYTEYLRE